jgi:phosphatidate cytidylyltransferase
MGLVLILLACGVLFLDQFLAPWYPSLLLCLVGLGLLACLEMQHLLSASHPSLWLSVIGVLAVLLANWPAHVFPGRDVWRDISGAFAAVVVLGFLVEMAQFREPGGVVVRLALLVWTTAYLGLLPSFLAQLRWWPPLPDQSGPDLRGVLALALTIFVPKFGDIGAYFTGRLLGRHKMTPLLSPKKTWEGLAGGLLASMLTAVALNRLGFASSLTLRVGVPSHLLGSDWQAAGFGLVVGGAGVLGDLAESLIKRDCRQKDASHVVPGFGGVLDVIDSILFAAPVAYWWLRGW